MEIIERKENPLLGRVELTFQWDHPNDPTPSLSAMVEAAAKSEPGADKKLVFVKYVGTRFGMSRTSGLALVYESEKSASIEPNFISDRHKSLNQPSKKEEKKTPEKPSDEDSEEPDEEEGEG